MGKQAQVDPTQAKQAQVDPTQAKQAQKDPTQPKQAQMNHTRTKQVHVEIKNLPNLNGPVYPPERITQVHEEEPECCCGCRYEGTTTWWAILNCCPIFCCCPGSIFYCWVACKGRNPDAAHAASICNTIQQWIWYVLSACFLINGICNWGKKPINTIDYKGKLSFGVVLALLGYLFQYMAGKYSEFEEYLTIEEAKRKVEEGSNL